MAKNVASGLYLYFYKRSEDTNNKDKDLKTKIYHIVLNTML